MTASFRLRHIAQVNPATPEFDRLSGDAPLTFLPLEAVWPGAALDRSRVRTKADVASGYTRFRAGDILVPKITPTFQANRSVIATGLVGNVGVGTTELHVVRPGPSVEPRYLLYSLSSRPFLQEGEASMIGVAGQKRVPDDFIRNLCIRLPPLPDQRAIADYLDAETTRIDALVASRQGMIDLLDERRSAVIADLTGGVIGNGVAPARTRLKFAVGRPTSGNRDHAFTDDNSGIPCLRGLNIKPGWVDQANLMRISETDHREHAATILRSGDVVVVRSGNAGTAAVVPRELDGANCVDLVIIRQAAKVAPKYLEYLLNSPEARTQAEIGVFGATLTHFNAVDVGELSLFIPSTAEQAALVGELDELTASIDKSRAAMQRQVDVLLECRQALITAAVTGQLEIPGVAA